MARVSWNDACRWTRGCPVHACTTPPLQHPRPSGRALCRAHRRRTWCCHGATVPERGGPGPRALRMVGRGPDPGAHAGTVPPLEPWCPMPSSSRSAVDTRNISGANGQACFFFSTGCTPGCAECDGVTRGPLPNFTGTQLVVGKRLGKREVSMHGFNAWAAPHPLTHTHTHTRPLVHPLPNGTVTHRHPTGREEGGEGRPRPCELLALPGAL